MPRSDQQASAQRLFVMQRVRRLLAPPGMLPCLPKFKLLHGAERTQQNRAGNARAAW
jgi:hypothetical protein